MRSAVALVLLALAAGCASVGEHSSFGPYVATPHLRTASSQHSGTVVFTVSRLLGNPVPGGPYALSSATNSIAGTIGSSVVGPIVIGPSSPRCAQASGILTCTLSAKAKAGAHPVSLYAYSTTDGTGAKLARGLGSVMVYAGHKNHVSSLSWNGFAKSIAVVAAPSSLLQGHASTAQIAAYGVDAAGGMIALPYVRGPDGKYISGVTISETGPYVAFQTPAPSSETPGLYFPVTFQYDGVLAGTEKVRAKPINADVKAATTKLRLLPGPSTNAALFVQSGDGFDGGGGNVFQFVPSGSPNVAPLRSLALSTVLAGTGSNGAFWGLKKQEWGFSELDEYDRYGNVIGRITPEYQGASPDNLPFIGAAVVDRSGNAYVVDQLVGKLPKIDVYAAGCNACPPQSSTPVGTKLVPSQGLGVLPYIAVDSSGNAYVAENLSGNSGSIFEYAPGGTSPLRTISASHLYGMAADSAGDLYAIMTPPSSGYYTWELFKYPPSGPPTALLSNSTNDLLTGVATGPDDTLYVALGYRPIGADPFELEIKTLAPGASTWNLLIGGTATGLPQDQIQSTIEIP